MTRIRPRVGKLEKTGKRTGMPLFIVSYDGDNYEPTEAEKRAAVEAAKQAGSPFAVIGLDSDKKTVGIDS